ncbi:MAG: MBL fold metallo-hydrolase [Patescibacteria group bacterium]|nr:MBL fold metallo-hydrolase [Patescibacteria group bacterium]MDE1944121.1 MBL fold metallo-hydrolase [Patescibacteria group bacterium]MDE1945054.1 MBL fold metallo-hydrolase [Patescibacteria group bacterium]MDE2057514.1 MBL fold metallo-hydrolase [Patescibacteria group bacterium]
MRLHFYGAAEKVTGSNFLVEGGKGGRVLVDCGLEQGADFCAECVYGPFPYDPATIDALVVTHAHLDHVGRIPKLVRDGFKGKIYMTPPTCDLAKLILEDSVGILSQDAKRRHLPPLYEEADVARAFAEVETLGYHEEREVAPGLSVYLRNTGHILGSASVRIKDEDGAAVALTGDIGNAPSPLLPDWEAVEDCDALVMESVYGDRLHPERSKRVERLREVLSQAIAKGGAILIPAFSMERTQLMLYELSNFFSAGTLPKVPVYLDSPLAIRVTGVYEKWGPTYFKQAAEDELKREGSLFDFPFLTKTLSPEESRGIEAAKNPKIIIAGAGMSHGGRIGRWEAKYLPDPSTTLVIVGYQAPGSPGRRLAEGEKRVKLGGQWVTNRATVEILEGWSAHADRDGLLDFAEQSLAGKRIKTVFAALGEPASERFLAQRIHDYFGARAVAATEGETWNISRERVQRV